MAIVEEAIAHYDELFARHEPTGWWHHHAEEVRRHWPAEMSSFVLRPFMIDEATYAANQVSLAHVMAAFTIATDRLANDETLRRALGIPAYLEPLLELDRAHGKPTIAGRLDGLVGSDGGLTLIEFNSEPQSAAFQHEVERSFERQPIAHEFARQFRVRSVDLFDQMFDALAVRGGDRLPCVAVIDRALWKQPRRAAVLRPVMHASARGCPVLYVDPEELEYRDGKLSASGITIDLVAFVNWELLINAKKRLAKVLRAIGDGAVGVVGGLSRGLLASYKVVLELLSSPDYRALFTPAQIAALDRHVPWTRLLRPHLLEHVAANQARLVIKPSGGGGGSNVTIGREVASEAWAATIERGLAQGWIVQALAVPERQRFPVATLEGVAFHDLNTEYSPYVWNASRVEGVLCRVVAGSVLHDATPAGPAGPTPTIGIANGIETPTWIVDYLK